MGRFLVYLRSTVLLFFSYFNICLITADIPAAPVNVTVRQLQANSAVVSWEVPDGDAVIGYAISQQKKDVRMLRLIQEVNTTTRSCVLWDLEENTEYIVHVQSITLSGVSPASDPISFWTPKEAEKSASKEEVQQHYTQLRMGEMIIILVVLVMWAGNMISSRTMNLPIIRTKPRALQSTAHQSTQQEVYYAASFQRTSLL
ncbi:fibronectin type III domain-containing protein 5 isoform X2 [Chiloscyllium plagiosum]|uniref:fibronectin type III domain-containing protein 5 isoform X2 n=1 Tax=Chiloscyllium plagiosum TaxID=36176 RepID=UPI001CB8872C|nr:fibronectin type III domain-containing protein 5 isoform X2 [Chiloscyllium plagiosum]